MDFQTEDINSIKRIKELINKYIKKDNPQSKETWFFRGLSDYNYKLHTSIDRALINFNKEYKDNIIKNDNYKSKIEQYLIKHYIRHGSRYLPSPPDIDDLMEWLSIMQHHLAPTRIMDWTYSFLIALFFAVYDLKENYCSVVAINYSKLKKQTIKYLAQYKTKYPNTIDLLINANSYKDMEGFCKAKYMNAFKDLIYCNDPDFPSFVDAVNPFKFDERPTLQQSVFLIQSNIHKTFEEALENTIKDKKNIIKKYNIPIELKSELLHLLYSMNISYATLFPDLDGFSKSLKNLHHIYNFSIDKT